MVYRRIVDSEVDINALHKQAAFNNSMLAKAILLERHQGSVFDGTGDSFHEASATSSMSSLSLNEDQNEMDECFDGCSLLHLACRTADVGMIELLLQYGANINARDAKSQTPLHHCILRGRTSFAKLLVAR